MMFANSVQQYRRMSPSHQTCLLRGELKSFSLSKRNIYKKTRYNENGFEQSPLDERRLSLNEET